MYQDQIPIPPLVMVYDVMAVGKCNSIDTLNCNCKTDSFIQQKKLESQVGEGKCQWVHCGQNDCESQYYANGMKISQTETYKYLGDHVSDGWDPLYNKRLEKAHGYNSICLAMSTEMSLGFYVYSFAKLLHQSMFVNGTLQNMETWPNCTTSRIEAFERVEQTFFKKILKAHSRTPIESIYLELGVIPLRFQLMKRRILYLHTIMKRGDDEITKQLVCLQKVDCLEGDYYAQTKRDLLTLSILEKDLSKSKGVFKDIVVKRVQVSH